VGAELERAQTEIFLALGLGRLVEHDLVRAARDGLAIPRPILSAGRERPPIEELAVADRDRAVVLLDSPLHLLEQFVEQRLVLLSPGFEVSIFRTKMAEDLGVDHFGILPQPMPWIVDGHPMALIAEG